MIKAALIVGLGSFLGGSFRYLAALWIERRTEGDFPWAILCINILGSFLIGLMTPAFERSGLHGELHWPLFLCVGVMGGFTTFSTFSLQTLKLLQSGSWGLATANAVASVLCCLLSVFAGLKLGQSLFG